MLSGRIVRMPFDTERMIRMHDCVPQQTRDQPVEVFRAEEGRRTTPQMYLADHRGAFHQFQVHTPFGKNGPQIFFFHLVVGRDLLITATVDTELLTERQMDVKAYSLLIVTVCKSFPKRLLPARDLDPFLPERHCRIAGIARNRLIHSLYKGSITLHGLYFSQI